MDRWSYHIKRFESYKDFMFLSNETCNYKFRLFKTCKNHEQIYILGKIMQRKKKRKLLYS